MWKRQNSSKKRGTGDAAAADGDANGGGHREGSQWRGSGAVANSDKR